MPARRSLFAGRTNNTRNKLAPYEENSYSFCLQGKCKRSIFNGNGWPFLCYAPPCMVVLGGFESWGGQLFCQQKNTQQKNTEDVQFQSQFYTLNNQTNLLIICSTSTRPSSAFMKGILKLSHKDNDYDYSMLFI